MEFGNFVITLISIITQIHYSIWGLIGSIRTRQILPTCYMLAASEGKLYNCTYYIVQHWQYIVLLILPTCIHVDIEIPISQSVYQRNRSDKNDIIKYFISIYAPCDFQKQINTCPWFMSIVVTYFAQLIFLCHTTTPLS